MGQTSDASHLFEYCPSHRNTHVPLVEDVERYRELTAPHVESFNYFLELGLKAGIQDIEPSEICLVDPVKLLPSSNEIVDWSETSSIRFWVEDVHVGYPTKVNTTETKLQLYPRECRERGMVYAGPLTGTFCYQIIERRNEIEHPGTVVRLPKRNFGNLPIMVMSKACHLAGMTPKDLVRLKEEVCNRFLVIFLHLIPPSMDFSSNWVRSSPCKTLSSRSVPLLANRVWRLFHCGRY